MNKARFADAIGVHASYVSRMVNHDVYPDDRIIDAVCARFRVLRPWLDGRGGPKHDFAAVSSVGDVEVGFETPPTAVQLAVGTLQRVFADGDPRLVGAVTSILDLLQVVMDRDVQIARLSEEKEVLRKEISDLKSSVAALEERLTNVEKGRGAA